MQCPRCESESIRRSRRNLVERVLLFFLLPYRCRSCETRFYRLRFFTR